MKLIVYFLLICNIGFAAWHFRGLGAGDGKASLDINNENELILLSEFKQHQKKLSSESGSKLCFSLGPFTQKQLSSQAQTLLKTNNIKTERIRLRDTSRRGFWVILPASQTRKQAIEHILKLKKYKIKDYFLVATGPDKNAVSLGVFSQKKLARKRVDQMIRLGFIPRMENVALPRKVYWLNWYKDSKIQPDNKIISQIKKSSPKISKIERSCK